MMKPWIATFAALVVAVAGLTIALTPQQTEREHPLLENLQSPPVNMPVRAPTFPREQVRPQLPDDGQPAVLILRGEVPFSGALQARGTVAVQRNVVEFRPAAEEQEAIRVLYRLPDGLEPLEQGTFDGSVEVQDVGGPEGSDRRLIVRGEDAIRFGEIWQSRPEPLDIALGQGVRIVQTARAQRQEQGYTPVEAQLIDNGEAVTTLPIGEATQVRTRAGMLTLYTATSQYFRSGDERLAQYPSQYTLHVWIRGQ